MAAAGTAAGPDDPEPQPEVSLTVVNAAVASPGSPITRRANIARSIPAIAAPSAASSCA
jgi:hypothetical protein